MGGRAPTLTQVIDDGRWLAHRYDEASDSIQFRLVPREAQREITFLTDAEIGDAPLAAYLRADCIAEVVEGNAGVDLDATLREAGVSAAGEHLVDQTEIDRAALLNFLADFMTPRATAR